MNEGNVMTQSAELPSMPFEQACPLQPAPLLRALQEDGPIHRVCTRMGDEAWLVTGYEQVRALYGDDRVGRAHPDPDRAGRLTASALFGGRPRENSATEDADRAWVKDALGMIISPPRLRELRPWVDELVTRLLDDLAAADRPADLVKLVAVPLPTLVICKLLGVPQEHLARYLVLTESIASAEDEQRSGSALAELTEHLRDLLASGRVAADGFISRVRATPWRIGRGAFRLGDRAIADLAAAMMFTGHHTTVVAIGYGVLLLLTNPDQHRAVLADPTKLHDAVEECLRVGNVGVNTGGGNGIPTYARADIDIAGVRIKAGELILLDTGSANHDRRVFADAYRFDINRPANPHLTFGHGRHYCAGASLARLEMQALFTQMLPRFPAMRLAARPEALRAHHDQITGGLVELPVTW
jgi:pentalenolactone synthase